MDSTPTPVENTLPALSDATRLAALRRYALLDTPAEQGFDRLTRLASRLVGAPISLISLVDEDRQFFKSQCGLPEPWASMRQTPLSHSFCQHVVIGREPLVIEDARHHPLVHDNLAIRDLGVVAYLGVPLTSSGGHHLGTLCVIDTKPREWLPEELELLLELSGSVITEIELRVALREIEREQAEREAVFARVTEQARDPHALARLERIRESARIAEDRLANRTATLIDVAIPPRDVLWLAEQLDRLREADARGT